MTVRGRAVVAVLAAFPIGWLYIDVAWRLVAALLAGLRGSNGGRFGCGGSGPGDLVGQFNGCNSLQYRSGYAVVELIVGTAILVAVGYALARWVSQPLRRMVGAVDQLGPTNLGLRLRQRGARGDETRRLADAIDRMLDRLAEGYEAQRRFASNASHELRTPLATQRALIEVSLSPDLTSDQIDLLSRQLLSTNERNERLIEGLLVLAETDRGLATTGDLDLARVAAEVAESMRPAAAERTVSIDVTAAAAPIHGELALVERLVGNLVENAIKYNHPDGRIDVRTGPPGVLVVSNSGPVVPAHEVAGLFEPFRRLSGDRLDHGGGVGLGLTIARSIVSAHHGTITAHANPGGGLSVEVRLPAAR